MKNINYYNPNFYQSEFSQPLYHLASASHYEYIDLQYRHSTSTIQSTEKLSPNAVSLPKQECHYKKEQPYYLVLVYVPLNDDHLF